MCQGKRQAPNAAIDRAGSICGMAKLMITGTLIPLRSNELLCRQ
jgi:hypothetical protein